MMEHTIFVKEDSNNDVILVPFGDIHIGSVDCDYQLIDKVINFIKESKAKVIGMGDYIENGTKGSVGAGVYGQTLTPDEQYNEIDRLLAPISGQILGLLHGNHEDRTLNVSGICLTSKIAAKLDCKYLGWGNFVNIRAGKNLYRIYATHGYSGARKLHTKLNAVRQLADAYEADIYLMGHAHTLIHESENIYTTDGESVIEKERFYIMTGGFLGGFNPISYQTKAAYSPGKTGVPVITLSSKEWKVKVEEFRG